jgi:hypothetical protein
VLLHSSETTLCADIVAKVFLGRRSKIPKAADALTRGEVRDHIVSSKIDHASP